MRFLLIGLLIAGQCFLTSKVQASEQAQAIFEELAPSLYQIRLIEKASGEKSTIGSGFQVSKDGLIATNYHVISGFAQHPEKYRIEYLDRSGQKGLLNLVNIDVINDLAITKLVEPIHSKFFSIATNAPEKGEQLFSLGNPHDLGMIVVPGTYNGLKKESFNDRIHFTGAVNSGMSGGPVVNSQGQVVGVNVASSGNQIGFLIPHDKLLTLLTQTSEDININEQIGKQLHANQARFINTLLAQHWKEKPLGQSTIPVIDVPFIRCWGDSNADDKESLFFTIVSQCQLEERIFLSGSFNSGTFEMEFRWLESKELDQFRFAQLYEQQIVNASPSNLGHKDDITEFSCQHDLVKSAKTNMNNKAILCTRGYKKHADLYDIVFVSASIDRNQEALISHFTLGGVSQELGLAFTQKFMESVAWN